MEVKSEYICSTCGAAYDTEAEARECEYNHTICVCQIKKGRYATFGQILLPRDRFADARLDFKGLRLELAVLNDDFRLLSSEGEDFSYCPYCGRCLKSDQEVRT